MRLHHWVKWHKWVGACASIFVISLSVTGIILLHTDDLSLSKNTTSNTLLMKLYGIDTEYESVSFYTGNTWIVQINERLYINDAFINSTDSELIGVVWTGGFYVLAFNDHIDLRAADLQLVERINSVLGLPGDINKIAYIDSKNIIIRSDSQTFISDLDLLSWTLASDNEYPWITPSPLPSSQLELIKDDLHGPGISIEKVVLDIHTGRIFGTVGVIAMDIAVILFLILTLSGWVSWYKRRELNKRRISNFKSYINDKVEHPS
jgi:hypothetical protein